jgi:hypothetical protein
MFQWSTGDSSYFWESSENVRHWIGGDSDTHEIFDLREQFTNRHWSFLVERLRNEIGGHLQCIRAEKPWSTDWENYPLGPGDLIGNGSDMIRKSACNVTLRNSERRVVSMACEEERNSGGEGYQALEARTCQDEE